MPDLLVPREKPLHIGRYCFFRLKYLKQHLRELYINLRTTCKLNEHLSEIDRQARDVVELLASQIAQAEGISEAFKAADQIAWVGAMNNILNRAEELAVKIISLVSPLYCFEKAH